MSNDDCNESSSCPSQFKSLYIGNLDPRVYEGILIQMLSGFGKITRSILAKDYRGESRGFAFVEFESTHSAEQAVEHMNGRLIGNHSRLNLIIITSYGFNVVYFCNYLTNRSEDYIRREDTKGRRRSRQDI